MDGISLGDISIYLLHIARGILHLYILFIPTICQFQCNKKCNVDKPQETEETESEKKEVPKASNEIITPPEQPEKPALRKRSLVKKSSVSNEMTRGQRANKAKMKQRTDDEETYTITHIVGSVVDIIDDGKQKSEARLGETQSRKSLDSTCKSEPREFAKTQMMSTKEDRSLKVANTPGMEDDKVEKSLEENQAKKSLNENKVENSLRVAAISEKEHQDDASTSSKLAATQETPKHERKLLSSSKSAAAQETPKHERRLSSSSKLAATQETPKHERRLSSSSKLVATQETPKQERRLSSSSKLAATQETPKHERRLSSSSKLAATQKTPKHEKKLLSPSKPAATQETLKHERRLSSSSKLAATQETPRHEGKLSPNKTKRNAITKPLKDDNTQEHDYRPPKETFAKINNKPHSDKGGSRELVNPRNVPLTKVGSKEAINIKARKTASKETCDPKAAHPRLLRRVSSGERIEPRSAKAGAAPDIGTKCKPGVPIKGTGKTKKIEERHIASKSEPALRPRAVYHEKSANPIGSHDLVNGPSQVNKKARKVPVPVTQHN